MPISITCPTCTAAILTSDVAVGRRVKCPRCGERIQIPAPNTPSTELVSPVQPKRRGYYRLAWLTVAAVLPIALTVGFVWAINRRVRSGPSAAAYAKQIERLRSELADERGERERLSKVVAQQKQSQPRPAAGQTPKSGSPAKAPPAPKTVAEVEDAIIRDAQEIQVGLAPGKRKRAWELLPEADQFEIRNINSEIATRRRGSMSRRS